MLIKPKLYDEFKCRASECTDTCCAGWEIYVDEDTVEYYNSLEGDIGELVRGRLTCSDDGVILCREGERCPFLNGENLCELILEIGDGALCDICSDHPRFFCGTENITAVGVGLCCPEAARLWLKKGDVFVSEDDGLELNASEKELFADFCSLIEYVLHGEGDLGARLCELISGSNSDEQLYCQLKKLYSSLELLDKNLGERFSDAPPTVCDARFSRLAVYFIFRYYFLLPRELCIKFTAASLIMIAAMGGDVEEAAKDYSKEIEYDTDNLDKIYGFLEACSSLGELCKTVLKF